MTERPGPPNKQPSDEARLGASLAFGNSNSNKPPVKPKPKPGAGNNAVGDNGALAAALSSAAGVGKGRPLVVQNTGGSMGGRGAGRGGLDGPPLREQSTGGSVASEVSYNGGGAAGTRNLRPRLNQYSPGGAGYLQPSMADQSRSPSFIAATLAASRSASLSPNPTGGRMSQPMSPTPVLTDPRKQSRYTSRSPSVRSSESSRFSEETVLDTRSIPPTGNLIGMFEQNAVKSRQDPEKRKIVKRPKTPTLSEESPVRMNPAPARPTTPTPLVNKPKKVPPQPNSPKPNVVQSKGQVVPPAVTAEPVTPRPKKKPPPAVQERKPSLPSSKPILISAKSPKLPPPQDDSSSGESFVSASDYQQASYEEPKPSWRAELASQNRRRLTSASLHTLNSSVAVNALADAIVASSLASSRAVSPSKSLRKDLTGTNVYPPLPPPPRRTKHHRHHPAHIFHNGKNEISRTPSPGKVGNGGTGVLRTTMRKVKSKEEIDEGEKRRARKNLMKKHPNKHHEGDRKRWRDSITERERKRYEAVWASNRGLHTGDAPGAENEVCSLVVRDVYNRSRLSEDVLEEAYALVDRRGIGMLGKEEFVVGLWLVDQRLKGRKLPVRVGESVWKSVGILGGIKVRQIK